MFRKCSSRAFISVNLDDGYKVAVFDTDIYGDDGRILDPVCRKPRRSSLHIRPSSKMAFPLISPREC